MDFTSSLNLLWAGFELQPFVVDSEDLCMNKRWQCWLQEMSETLSQPSLLFASHLFGRQINSIFNRTKGRAKPASRLSDLIIKKTLWFAWVALQKTCGRNGWFRARHQANLPTFLDRINWHNLNSNRVPSKQLLIASINQFSDRIRQTVACNNPPHDPDLLHFHYRPVGGWRQETRQASHSRSEFFFRSWRITLF